MQLAQAPCLPATPFAALSPTLHQSFNPRCTPQRENQPVLFAELDTSIQRAVLAYLCDDTQTCDWTEHDVVQLHWLLLKQTAELQDPQTPLADKLDTLRWVAGGPDKDHVPFSFVSCVRVVGTSPLSPTPYFGLVGVDAIRHWIAVNAQKWLKASLDVLPPWVQQLILAHPDWPDWLAERLDRQPQWLNEQIRALGDMPQLDLFQPHCGES